MLRTIKLFMKVITILFSIFTILIFTIFATSAVESTQNGAHKRLLPSVGTSKTIAVNLFSGTGENVKIPNFLDGPIVRKSKHGHWEASWFCENRVEKTTVKTPNLAINCAGTVHTFSLEPSPIPDAYVKSVPEKTIVLSDLEGNLSFLENALKKLQIIDSNGTWSFSNNRLVILGDSVDRGRDAYAVLWRLYHLNQQAHKAGGAVHVVLGNHEQYVLRNNISRMNPEHLYALEEMGGYEGSFARDTIIGSWLRKQPVILKIGSVVFVHGGIHIDITKAGHTLEQLNASMNAYWNKNGSRATKSSLLDSVLGYRGVTQYRGFVMPLEDTYPQATQVDVEAVLKHFNASHIVVAHTLVDRVTPLYQNKIYAVDVNANDAKAEVLSFENGIPKIINIGISRNLQESEKTVMRNFNITDGKDIEILRQWIQHTYALSQLPHPY